MYESYKYVELPHYERERERERENISYEWHTYLVGEAQKNLL